MKMEAILKQAIGTEAALSDASRKPAAAPVAPWDWWRRARDRMLRLSRRAPRRLRLCESLPLGERRFVAVVEFEHARFLLGGTSASLVLLARLENAPSEIMAVTAPGDSGGGGK